MSGSFFAAHRNLVSRTFRNSRLDDPMMKSVFHNSAVLPSGRPSRRVASTRRLLTRRSGTATVEAAVCLPVVILLIFASIECCTMIFLEESLYVAGYEGIRAAVQPDGKNADVLERCNAILATRDVTDATITLVPPDIEAVARGDVIALTVAAPCDANSMMPGWFFGGRVLDNTVVMVKE